LGMTGDAPSAMEIPEARVREIQAWVAPQPRGVGPPIRERAAWERLAPRAEFAAAIAEAEALAQQPIPETTDELYLDYSRTGNRDAYQKVLFARAERLGKLTLAECLEARERFLQPIAETIAALCAQRTWLFPAHDGDLKNFRGEIVDIDLWVAHTAWDLATVDALLGERLPPETRRLLRDNVQRRVFGPYRDMVEGRRPENFWLRITHNWNAVCLAGVTGAALALEESPERRAWFIAAAERYIPHFLRGFTPDGYCSEGLGYWNYGFGYYLMLAETLRQATGGRVELLADPAARAPALFPLRAEILNGVYLMVADCFPNTKPGEKVWRYCAERFGLPVQGRRDATFLKPDRSLVSTVLFAFLPERLPVVRRLEWDAGSRLRTWFADAGVLICRPKSPSGTAFAAALKGGHNAEHHNHNDVGSFSVVAGRTMVLCDPGTEVYTRRTFSAERYQSKVLNSYGHAVPVVAGQLQRPGADARAVVLRTNFTDRTDTLVLDLRSAYAVPTLQKLERTFVFQRARPMSLTVRDEVAFAEPAA
ncbi:MAG: heparinase II/III family protein, partial [Verrucomicrobiales bacterium]|nr:heparinase II/III family protein [Verrucomicrobiales bacterium]